MIYFGGCGRWGLKDEGIFSRVFLVVIDKICFVFAVGFRFGFNLVFVLIMFS